MGYSLYWSNEALTDLEEILAYLKNRWTEREIINFKLKLVEQLSLIERNPLMFPKSELSADLRKAVLSKQTIIFYQIRESEVYLVHLFVTKKDTKRIT